MLPAADLTSRLSFDVQSVAALRMRADSGDPAVLKAAAKQFEAMFIQTMLKTVRQTHFTSEGDVFGDSSSLKLYQELLDQQWSQAIAGGKGFGLADILVKKLTMESQASAAAASETAAKAGAENAKTGMSTVIRTESSISMAPSATPAQPAAVQDDRVDEDAGGQSNDGSPEDDRAADRKRHFVEAMLPYARAAEKASGIPVRFVLAHAALESGWGQHEIVSANGMASHNLFGIKAGGGWDGNTVSTTTTEYRQGLAMKITARFRAYADYAEAFVDYARLLKRRYGRAVSAGDNAEAFAAGLASGGYATDPLYAQKLRGAIRSVSMVAGA
jgi:flagellar protein FlgJ